MASAGGIEPQPVGSLPRHLAALMQTNVNVQGLTVEAALSGRRDRSTTPRCWIRTPAASCRWTRSPSSSTRCWTRTESGSRRLCDPRLAMPDSGLPRSDAKADFARERRRRALAHIAERMRREPDDVGVMLPFEEVVAALGRRSQVDLGVQPIPLDSIVGTVDRRKADFDRSFRPASTEMRSRWERIAAARRRGEAMPPIDVFRIGDLHFVQDGHHRVSVARALGDTDINAHVIEVKTKLGADRALQMRDLPLKRHERVFFERVPLPPARASGSSSPTSGATHSSARWSRAGGTARAWTAGT